MRSLRDWGQAGKYNHVRHGFNYRMDGVQGAALGVKLAHLDALERRPAGASPTPTTPVSRPELSRAAGPFGDDHACPRLRDPHSRPRGDARRACSTTASRRCMHYPTPVHLQPAYAHLGAGEGSLPVTEALSRETLSLPLYPELADAARRRGSSMPSTRIVAAEPLKPPDQE